MRTPSRGSPPNQPMPKPALPAVRIEKVSSARDLRTFIHLPFTLYRDDPYWVPPLLVEQRLRYSKRNPFFQHASWCAWLAYRGKTPVGRISAQIDELYLQRYQDATGFFGSFESQNDRDAIAALLQAAETWLQEKGMQRVRGPFNLSINEECGLLVEGLETAPQIMMGHARPYYPERLEELGYHGVQDLLAYLISADFTRPKVMSKLAARIEPRVHLRPLRRSRLNQDLETLRDIFNDAWSENWGFVPFTRAEFAELGKALSLFVDEDFIQIAELDGVPAAFVAVLPNINEAIRDLGGRLLPFGWLKLLWRLKVRHPRSARLALMGVRKRYQQTPAGPALAFLVTRAIQGPVQRRGVQEVEMSWILESNSAMKNIIEAVGGHLYKTYRIYERSLTRPIIET